MGFTHQRDAHNRPVLEMDGRPLRGRNHRREAGQRPGSALHRYRTMEGSQRQPTLTRHQVGRFPQHWTTCRRSNGLRLSAPAGSLPQASSHRGAPLHTPTCGGGADDPNPPASSPRIRIPRILLLLNLASNAPAMVHLIWGASSRATPPTGSADPRAVEDGLVANGGRPRSSFVSRRGGTPSRRRSTRPRGRAGPRR